MKSKLGILIRSAFSAVSAVLLITASAEVGSFAFSHPAFTSSFLKIDELSGDAFRARGNEFVMAGLLNRVGYAFNEKIGGIVGDYRYAWGENFGWIDFSPENASIAVGENVLSGWTRITNLGWVHLGEGDPRNGLRYSNLDAGDYGVNNNGSGVLSGWGWGETFGWICFGNVRIDKNGVFSGYAWSDNVGNILIGSNGPVPFAVRTDPYPWSRIGGGEEIRKAGNPSSNPINLGNHSLGRVISYHSQNQATAACFILSETAPAEVSWSGRRGYESIPFNSFQEHSIYERGPPGAVIIRRSPDNLISLFSTRLSCFAGFYACLGVMR